MAMACSHSLTLHHDVCSLMMLTAFSGSWMEFGENECDRSTLGCGEEVAQFGVQVDLSSQCECF